MFNGTESYYQPIPFPEYVGMDVRRHDCEDRYSVIKAHYGEFKEKTMIDIGCANGYFGWRFLQDGGRSCVGVDNDMNEVDFINDLAKTKNVDFIGSNVLIDGQYDVGVFLDLYYHQKTEECGFLEFLAKNCTKVFTSCCRGNRNKDYAEELKKHFSNVKHIYAGFEERVIYACWNTST